MCRLDSPRVLAVVATIVWAVAFAIGLIAPAVAEDVSIPPPARLPCVAPTVVAPAFLSLSLELPLADLLARVEANIPAELGSAEFERYERDQGDLQLQYGLSRGAMTPSWDGDRFTLESPIHYWMNVQGDGFDPTGCASPEDPVLIRSALITRIGWRDDWRIDAHVTPRALVFQTRCKPKPPGVNFTPLLSSRIEQRHTRPFADAIVIALRGMDDIELAVRAAWESLTREKEFRNADFRLALNLSAIRVEPIRCEDGRMFADLEFEAVPRIVSAGGSSPAPLPPLPSPRVRLSDGRMRLPIDLEISWAEMEATVMASVAGKTYPDPQGEFGVEGVRAFASGRNVILAVEVSGAIDGTVYLEGTPTFDESDNTLGFSEIRPTAETAVALGVKGLDEFGPGLQLALRFPLGDALGQQAEEVGRAINGGWGGSVSTRGGMARWESREPFVSEEGFGLRSVLLGSVAVTVAE